MTHFILRGFGLYAPEKVLTNADLEKIVDTSDEWITTRTGIKERHLAAEDQAASDLALEASKEALEEAGIDPSELTHIICATFTPDSVIPSAACRLQERFGITGQMCMDVQAACSGFLYALQTARGLLCLEPESKILVVSSEVITRRMNWEDRATCVLFGDASGAAVMTAGAVRRGPRSPGRHARRGRLAGRSAHGQRRRLGLLLQAGRTRGTRIFRRVPGP